MEETKKQKHLLIRVLFDEPGTSFRIDMQKTGLTSQEAIGILEIAKNQLMNEIKQNQVVTSREEDKK
ncbi:hypothetical protein KY325_04180 [Candidatus Woesearchaeota archaeon]|nr:hypothetical protein [Candidatus Woesearchaeota archaeon]MBW3018333.1 hypothetical protein [Candidatus Woesearchaeota archaeon]